MPIPEGFHAVSPYILIPDTKRAIEFYEKAFDATQQLRMDVADGRVMHAELVIGDSVIMLGDPTVAEGDAAANMSGHHAPIHLFLYVRDVDTIIPQAESAGATVTRVPEDKDEGDRRGAIEDPFGFTWHIATQIKPISRAEMQKQYDEAMESGE